MSQADPQARPRIRPIRCDVREVLTVEQFLQLPEIKPALEFIEGRIEQKMSPKMPHSLLTMGFVNVLDGFARPRRLGRAFVELRCSFAGESHVPDVCLFVRGRLPKDERGEYLEDVFLPPDLMIEILSPGQTIARLSSRMTRCVANGVRLAWLVQPRMRRVYVFRPGQGRQDLGSGDSLEGSDVLPGFTLPVDEVFGWLVADE